MLTFLAIWGMALLTFTVICAVIMICRIGRDL
jgi:hypothetical protein